MEQSSLVHLTKHSRLKTQQELEKEKEISPTLTVVDTNYGLPKTERAGPTTQKKKNHRFDWK